ncbi:MAG: outer membrane protein assembly factor BamA [Chlamydiae bacterium]|nr:outer membrane protein assembly factor BamA [Chlamydiota bacterium]
MNNQFILLSSLILFTATPSLSQLAASNISQQAYENTRVARVEIVPEQLAPNATFDPKPILNKLKTKAGDPFSQSTFDDDLKTLAADYDRVEPNIQTQNQQLYITIKVWPRPTIRTIKWDGNTNVKTKTLQKELGIKNGSTYNRQEFNKSFNKVKEYYIKKGYFESQLQYKVSLDKKTNEVDVTILIKEGRSGKIQNIAFNGFTASEKSELLNMIYTKKYNLLTSWVSGQGSYNEEALEQDQVTILNYLQNKGYADAKVYIKIKESANKEKIIIEINADRGPVYHFGKVTFSGNEIFTDEQIEPVFTARPQDIYSPEQLRITTQNIKDLYGRKGYIETNVQYETKLVANQPIYNVEFKIYEGEQYKIGLIHVLGNTQTESNVILRESLLVPGEMFDSARLKATERKLQNIGYFKNVNVYSVRTQDDQLLGENYRDVYIEVEETTTGNISLFFGFSSADSLFGGLDLAESNFNYLGIGQVFSKGLSALRGGGEYAHAKISVGAKQTSYLASWMTPYFRDTLWRIGFDVNQTTSSLQANDYNIKTYGGSVFASYPFAPFWSFGLKYRIKDAIVNVSDPTPEEKKTATADGYLSAISSNVSFDSTDSAYKPHRGFRSLLEAEYAGMLGQITFLRYGYLNSFYTPLWKNGIMKYRFDFRFIQPVLKTPAFKDIPLSERFFMGGENTVRGYKAFDLGPHYANGDPTGGLSSGLISFEYLHEVVRILDLFIFADAGSISDKKFSIDTFRLSYGFGARLELMNRVPIVLGMGFPVNPDTRSEVRRFFFSMGGQF